VYDDAHLGHARCYITWDVLYRFLKFLGYDVTYVRNVTDVDDKILNRAKERGELPKDVAERNYESFKADMAALNVLSPDREPKATEYIGTMIEVIQGLIAKNAAYVASDGTVYFRVSADGNYGQLSKKPLDELKSGARVDVDPNKENPLDFALWKSVPPEEQTDEKLSQGYCFESPWGRGRPGWHIECSAMNYAILGPQIDIHAGGADLVFPHHENEIAQTETWQNLAGGPEDSCANHRFAKYWLHNGFVNVSGEKMSKSLGNFSTIKKLLERYDANTIRYFLLTNGYRMPVDFNDEALQAAANWVKKLESRLVRINSHLKLTEKEIDELIIPNKQALYRKKDERDELVATASEEELLKRPEYYILYQCLLAFELNLEKDLDTAQALANLNKMLSGFTDHYLDVHRFYFQEIMTMLYILGFNWQFLFASVDLPQEQIRTIYKELSGKWLEEDQEPEVLLAEIVEYRKKAKEIKNWTQADAIRKHLTDIGLQILDNKDGTTTVEKDGLEIVRV
jgi:cysteinyl-tRNA synthetase